jgi:multicomponent K+:H+ antiporter subunit F
MIMAGCAFALFAISISILMNIYRLIVGPSVTDRILALDTMVINAIGLIVLAGIAYGTSIYFEAALFFAMVGFVSTVAFCKFLLRGNVME